MISDNERRLEEHLRDFLSAERLQRLQEVLSQRTRYLACVLEDIYIAQNASAVIRHCDALGIQELHVIENKNRFKTDHAVSLGSSQWIELVRYRQEEDNTPVAMKALKDRGYRIIATSPHADDDLYPENVPLDAGPLAVVFGNEKHGISQAVEESADGFMRIPMVGFVESFNISASAAISLYTLSRRLRESKIPWSLDDQDTERILFEWIRKATPHAQALERRFYSGRN